MHLVRFLLILPLWLFIMASSAWAQITVTPNTVNIRQGGPSTAFLTFRGLRSDQRPMEGVWCREINPLTNACVPGTIFGRLPGRSDLSRSSGTSFTDIMTIPPSVVRRAYQSAQEGNPSRFFYVRRFAGVLAGLLDEFVPVTCRLASGGAGSPLALMEVKLRFAGDEPVVAVLSGEPIPPFSAEIFYNGSGRLKGRWEIVLPGDATPELRDLLTAGTLPLEERSLQRRYTLLERFDLFLPPTGKVSLPGPDPAKLPRGTDGLHLILLRIEATDDREAGSDLSVPGAAPGARINSGGVAGFPLPVLRYYVGHRVPSGSLAEPPVGKLQLVSPNYGEQLPAGQSVHFTWQDIPGASLYKLEVTEQEGEVVSAFVNPGVSTYTAPPWLQDHTGKPLYWRVQALGDGGAVIARSAWRDLQLQNTSSSPAPP